MAYLPTYQKKSTIHVGLNIPFFHGTYGISETPKNGGILTYLKRTFYFTPSSLSSPGYGELQRVHHLGFGTLNEVSGWWLDHHAAGGSLLKLHH